MDMIYDPPAPNPASGIYDPPAPKPRPGIFDPPRPRPEGPEIVMSERQNNENLKEFFTEDSARTEAYKKLMQQMSRQNEASVDETSLGYDCEP